MNWEAAGAIGEIVGAAAVIATLAYLAIQLRQNTKSVQSNSYALWAGNLTNVSLTSITDERVSVLLNDAWQRNEVTEETWIAFAMWHQVFFYHVEMVWQMSQRGSIGEEILELEMGRATQILATPVVRQWWEAGGNNQVSKPLALELEKRSAVGSGFTWLDWNAEKGFFARDA